MKVIHVLNHFLPKQIAGTEVYAYNLINELKVKGIEGIVVIPNYGKSILEEYFIDKIRVIQFAEPSVVDRALIMGKNKSDGLIFFCEILKSEMPSIVHFHEIAGSNGISNNHVEISKIMGFKNVITFHLSGNSCKTGNLMHKGKAQCDGVINVGKCAGCFYKLSKENLIHSTITYSLSLGLYKLGIDCTKWNNRIGTGLGFTFIIKKLKEDLFKLSDNCEALIVLTKWYKTILEKNGLPKDKINYISQGLTFQKKMVNLDLISKDQFVFKIIFLGRISAFKGLHLLIEAIKNINPQKILLHIYGQDPEDEYSKGLKKKSKKMCNVQWKGKLSPGEVVNQIANYDILCLPSTFSEMSPLVIQEAFAAKVPVLASNVYGNAEQIIDGVNGWLFKFKDVDDLKKKIDYLINNPAKVLIAGTNIVVPRNFEIVASEYIRVYNKILKEE